MNAAARLSGRWFATTTEVAEVLHVSEQAVRRAIDAGTMPATRVGEHLRVPVAWLETQAMRTESPPGDPLSVTHNEDQEDEQEGHRETGALRR